MARRQRTMHVRHLADIPIAELAVEGGGAKEHGCAQATRSHRALSSEGRRIRRRQAQGHVDGRGWRVGSAHSMFVTLPTSQLLTLPLKEVAVWNMAARKRRNRTALSAQRGAASEGGRHKGTWTGVDGA